MKRTKLKLFRVGLGLQSKEMAEKMGISKTHYSNIENGHKNPTYEAVEEFEELFGVDNVWEIFRKDK